MNYTDIRDQIKTGDLIGFTHKGWLGWYNFKVQMVRMFTRSEYSHVAIAYVMNDRIFILEAVGAEVRLFPLSRRIVTLAIAAWLAILVLIFTVAVLL